MIQIQSSHPANDTDKAAVSSVSRNGIARICSHCHHAEGCAEYKNSLVAAAAADSDLMLHPGYEIYFE